MGLGYFLMTISGSLSPCPVVIQTTFSFSSILPDLVSFKRPAMDAALEMAEEANDNGFPWVLEEDGCQVAHGNNGDLLGAYRYQG